MKIKYFSKFDCVSFPTIKAGVVVVWIGHLAFWLYANPLRWKIVRL